MERTPGGSWAGFAFANASDSFAAAGARGCRDLSDYASLNLLVIFLPALFLLAELAIDV